MLAHALSFSLRVELAAKFYSLEIFRHLGLHKCDCGLQVKYNWVEEIEGTPCYSSNLCVLREADTGLLTKQLSFTIYGQMQSDELV